MQAKKKLSPGFRVLLIFLAVLLVFVILSVVSIFSESELDKRIRAVAAPYRFNLFSWEFQALSNEALKLFGNSPLDMEKGKADVLEYFANVDRIRNLENQINAYSPDTSTVSISDLETGLDELRRRNADLVDTVERVLEAQIKEVLFREGIYNPADSYLKVRVGFPPLNFHLGSPPHVLVISPRDHIESLREVILLPDLTPGDSEIIEGEMDSFGVSSLVTGVGGMATYPSYVIDTASLRFVINTAVEEWLHQYLAFTPLGFRYVLDLTRIKPDYEIATINETVVGIISEEIGAEVYRTYYASGNEPENGGENTDSGFDFNGEMRKLRLAVDDLLATGKIEEAERLMEETRLYLAENGYFIRKINQAYFAFYGTYADSPTSVSPIGEEVRQLRSDTTSVKEFLDIAASITSRQELARIVR